MAGRGVGAPEVQPLPSRKSDMNLSNVKTLYKILLCFAVVAVFIAGTTWFSI